MILHLFLYFLYRFVFCIFLFVCDPALWLPYINKVMLCYVDPILLHTRNRCGVPSRTCLHLMDKAAMDG